jgi:hypothetical protein
MVSVQSFWLHDHPSAAQLAALGQGYYDTGVSSKGRRPRVLIGVHRRFRFVNSPMLPGLKKNADGSLTLYIQNESPGAGKESNWLPAPDGPIYLVMRLYWPKTEPPSVLPPGEGTWEPPAIAVAK